MRKFLLAFLVTLLSVSVSYGAVSEDMSLYVRKDVFEARMDKLDAKMTQLHDDIQILTSEIRVINTKLEALDKRMMDNETHTSNRIDDLKHTIDNRIDDLKQTTNNRLDDLKTVIYWGLSIIGLLVAFAIFAPSFGEFLKNLRKPSISVDEIQQLVERLIDTRLTARPQV